MTEHQREDARCTSVSPSGIYICERPAGHDGDHAANDRLLPGFFLSWVTECGGSNAASGGER